MQTNHHAPFPVELNGPAHIQMLIDISRAVGKAPDLEAIKRLAAETRQYIECLSRGDLPYWHELSESPRPDRDQIYKRLAHIVAVESDGSNDKLLSLATDAFLRLGMMP